MSQRVLMGAVLAAAACVSHAQVLTQWVGGDGLWQDASNWAGGAVPGDFGAVGVLNGGTTTAQGLDLHLRLGIFGGTIDGVTGDGAFEQIGGNVRFVNSFVSGAYAGFGLGTSGQINLSAGAAMQSGIFSIGADGQGQSRVSGGSTLEATVIQIAGRFRGGSTQRFTSEGTMVVEGAGTLVRATRQPLTAGLQVGTDGAGHLTIRDGAVVETNAGLVVSTVPSGSSLTIDGAGSVLRFGVGDGNAFLGFGRDITLPAGQPAGDTVVTLRDGGRIENADGFGSGFGVQLATQTLVRGSGTIVSNVEHAAGAIIDPGENGESGHIEISALLNNRLNPFGAPEDRGGTLRFDIGGTAPGSYDRLTVGALLAGGTLEVNVDDAYVAAFGDTFEIITILDQNAYNNLGGPFDDNELGSFGVLDLADLGGGLFFDVAYSQTGVTLRVVPTPGSGLVVCGSLLALRRRRRSIA